MRCQCDPPCHMRGNANLPQSSIVTCLYPKRLILFSTFKKWPEFDQNGENRS